MKIEEKPQLQFSDFKKIQRFPCAFLFWDFAPGPLALLGIFILNLVNYKTAVFPKDIIQTWQPDRVSA